jgi:hypothetical protein
MPRQLEAFEDLVKAINDFWLTTAQLPRGRYDVMKPSTEASLVRANSFFALRRFQASAPASPSCLSY